MSITVDIKSFENVYIKTCRMLPAITAYMLEIVKLGKYLRMALLLI